MVSGLHALAEGPDGRIWMGGYNGRGGFSSFDGQQLLRHSWSADAMPALPAASAANPAAFISSSKAPPASAPSKMAGFSSFGQTPFPSSRRVLPLSAGQRHPPGLFRQRPGHRREAPAGFVRTKLVGKDKGLALDNVVTITEDRAGRLWLARVSKGLALYDPAKDTATTWAAFHRAAPKHRCHELLPRRRRQPLARCQQRPVPIARRPPLRLQKQKPLRPPPKNPFAGKGHQHRHLPQKP